MQMNRSYRNSLETSLNFKEDTRTLMAVFSRRNEVARNGELFQPILFEKFEGADSFSIMRDHGLKGDTYTYGAAKSYLTRDGNDAINAYAQGEMFDTPRAQDLVDEYNGRVQHGLPVHSSIHFLHYLSTVRAGRRLTKEERAMNAVFVHDDVESIEDISLVKQGNVASADMSINSMSTAEIIESVAKEITDTTYEPDPELMERALNRIASWNKEDSMQLARYVEQRINAWSA